MNPRNLIPFILLFSLFGCEFHPYSAPRHPGMAHVHIDLNPIEVVDQIKEKIDQNEKLRFLGRYNAQVGDPNLSLIFFGNPKVGTPLMLQNRLSALDLPQRILAFEERNGGSMLVFNEVEYLDRAYGLTENPSLEKIKPALNALSTFNGKEATYERVANFTNNKGVYTRKSPNGFRTTLENLIGTAKDLGAQVLIQIDHSENARKAGINLPPTRILMLDQPELRTLLFNLDPSLALDIWPIKVLVWEDDKGASRVSMLRPQFHFERRKLNTNSKAFVKLRNLELKLLDGLEKQVGNPSLDIPS